MSSADLLHNEWHDAPLGKHGIVHPGPAHVETLLAAVPSTATFVTVQCTLWTHLQGRGVLYTEMQGEQRGGSSQTTTKFRPDRQNTQSVYVWCDR